MGVTTIQVKVETLEVLKLVKAKLEVKSYDEAIVKIAKQNHNISISDEIAKRIKKQASKTLWDESEYLRIVLDLYESQAGGKNG